MGNNGQKANVKRLLSPEPKSLKKVYQPEINKLEIHTGNRKMSYKYYYINNPTI